MGPMNILSTFFSNQFCHFQMSNVGSKVKWSISMYIVFVFQFVNNQFAKTGSISVITGMNQGPVTQVKGA